MYSQNHCSQDYYSGLEEDGGPLGPNAVNDRIMWISWAHLGIGPICRSLVRSMGMDPVEKTAAQKRPKGPV